MPASPKKGGTEMLEWDICVFSALPWLWNFLSSTNVYNHSASRERISVHFWVTFCQNKKSESILCFRFLIPCKVETYQWSSNKAACSLFIGIWQKIPLDIYQNSMDYLNGQKVALIDSLANLIKRYRVVQNHGAPMFFVHVIARKIYVVID